MDFITLLSVAAGLSMDAFAVSVCRGMKIKKLKFFNVTIPALFFGFFQALMPVAGWVLGSRFEKYIISFDHWIAFGLLAFTGGKMIAESLNKEHEDELSCSDKLNIRELTVLALATSIDALAVGITFAFLDVSVAFSSVVIGVTTFLLSCIGIAAGKKFGTGLKNKAETAGGVVLILIGVKILLEHTLGL